MYRKIVTASTTQNPEIEKFRTELKKKHSNDT